MAIVTFKSNAAGEIYMFRETAEKIFKVIGKPLGIRGVLTPEELPAAIAALKTEMEKEKEYLKAVREREDKLFKEGKDLDEERSLDRTACLFHSSELIRCWKCLN